MREALPRNILVYGQWLKMGEPLRCWPKKGIRQNSSGAEYENAVDNLVGQNLLVYRGYSPSTRVEDHPFVPTVIVFLPS